MKILTSLVPDPVPVLLQGEGHCGLSDIKDVEVSEEFVGLGEKVTHCQTEEFREDCLSRKYRERVLSQCNCSPFYLRSYYGNQVRRDLEKFDVKGLSRPSCVPPQSLTVLRMYRLANLSVWSTVRGR